MYNSTITVFNHYQSKSADIWYPTILRGVDLNIDRAAIVAKYGAESKDNAKLHIKYRLADGVKYIGNKPYLLPKDWEQLPNDELSKYITFASGNNFTFFMQGEFGDGTPINDADYTDGLYGYLEKRYDNVFAVSSVAEYSLIPHFEVLAK